MTCIVTENGIKCKYMDCVEVCPVDCFYLGTNMLGSNSGQAHLSAARAECEYKFNLFPKKAPVMSESLYPPATRDTPLRRRALAPEAHASKEPSH